MAVTTTAKANAYQFYGDSVTLDYKSLGAATSTTTTSATEAAHYLIDPYQNSTPSITRAEYKQLKMFFEAMSKGVKKANKEVELPARHTAISVVIEEKKSAELCDDCDMAIWVVERLYKGDKNYTCWIGNGMDYLEEHKCGDVECDMETSLSSQ